MTHKSVYVYVYDTEGLPTRSRIYEVLYVLYTNVLSVLLLSPL